MIRIVAFLCKMLVRAVGRALRIPKNEIDQATAHIDDRRRDERNEQ